MLRFLILSLFLLASPILAQEPTRLELKADELPRPGIAWFGLYMGKQKIGWVREFSERTDDEGIATGYEVVLQMQNGAEVTHMRMTERSVFKGKPPYRLLSSRSTEDLGQGVSTKSLERTQNGFRAMVHSAGEKRSSDVQIDFTLADQIGMEIWLRRGGLKVADTFSVRSLKTSEFKVGIETILLQSIKETNVRGVRQCVYTGLVSSLDDGEMGTFRAASSGQLISVAFGGGLEGRREPEALAKKLDAPVDMFALWRLPVDKALGDPQLIAELVLEASGAGVPSLKNGPRQTVEPGEKPGTCILKLGAGHGTSMKATEEETKKASVATREYQSDDERIIALAKQAVGDATKARQKTARLVTFVSDYIEDMYGPEYSNAVDVMLGKRGDCSAHANLFVALARAAGIPAREVTGFMYIGDEAPALGAHAWCEVVLDGHWVEVDPTWNEMELNATHVSFRGINGDSDMLKSAGNLSLRVIQIKRK